MRGNDTAGAAAGRALHARRPAARALPVLRERQCHSRCLPRPLPSLVPRLGDRPHRGDAVWKHARPARHRKLLRADESPRDGGQMTSALYYKVLRPELTSALVEGAAAVKYPLLEWVDSPTGSAGYGLFVFR